MDWKLGFCAAVYFSNEDKNGVNLGVPAGARVSSFMDIDRGAQDGEGVGFEGGGCSDNCGSADNGFEVRSSGFSRVVSAKEEDEYRSSEVKDEGNGYNQFSDEEGQSSASKSGNCMFNDKYEVESQNDEFEAKKPTDNKEGVPEAKSAVAEPDGMKSEREVEPSKSSSAQYKSLMTEFDEYVANERFGLIGSGITRALSYGFQVGDMVWAKVKSHPWWPGHVFNEAFASSSVRRTGRAGHVLVAFFGDSSYGWFDPAELIPFDANFSEKSQQTNSRNFMNAVEEAIDEISRRSGLGLACKCRNKYNFRPTHVQGYFVVDVPDCEQGAYTETQIKKARDSFLPQEILDFIQELAPVPQGSDQTALDFIKNKATVFAYRKAVFEEFDETYSQAFGIPATCPSHGVANGTDQPVKEQARAPLSGPLVIAETLGVSRSSSKPMKVKDRSMKDEYLFKRRDDSAPGSAGSLALAAYLEGSPALDTGGYLLQKRVPSVAANSQSPSKQEQGHSTVKTTLGQEMVGKPATTDGTPTYGSSFAFEGATEHAERVSLQENREDLWMKPAIPGLDQVQGYGSLVNKSLIGVKRANLGADGVVKKKKVVKRSPVELGSEMMTVKKKKRKELGPEQRTLHQQNRLVNGKAERPPALREGTQLDVQSKDEGSSSISDSAGPLTVTGTGNVGLELIDLLDGLQYLAVDHFHGVERTSPAFIKHSFLRFRSLVYQKSLVLAPASESDPVENRPAKSSIVGTTKQPPSEADRKSLLPKPVKPSLRPDDPSKDGRKRARSDRLEELEAKKLKSMNKLKSLTEEKKAAQKGQDIRPGEGKEGALTAPLSKSTKPSLARRMEPPPPPPSAAEPTMLVMKFPPETSLPSVPELKARFARFGPLDYNSIRVFWKTSTCRVVFQHKLHAQAAYKYATGNSSLFGNINVRYHIRLVDLPGPEGLETMPKAQQGDDSMSETLRSKDLNLAYQSILQQQSVQLRSCLKKPPGEDAGITAGNGGKGTARVKFLLGGEENPRQDQPVIGNSSSNAISGSFGGGAASGSTTTIVGGTIYNTKNLQQKSSLPPLLPLPPQFAISQPQNNSHRLSEISLRSQLLPPPPPPKLCMPLPNPTTMVNVDISQQMISLLTRCNDVVTSLTGFLGYVPYHPL